MSRAKVGILGGTFDPIHHGHLVVAEDCRTQLGLDEVLFVPAGAPPHKRGRPISPAVDRIEMVQRAIAGNHHFRLSRVDVDRPGASYSVEMVARLRRELGDGPSLFFIVGRDALADLPLWREPARLADLCQIVAVNRPGYPSLDLASLDPAIPHASERILQLVVPELSISASSLRQRVREGRPITYMTPDAVIEYIQQHRLYRAEETERGK
ncbi:MAG: nicotinate-nucleotide adenylyltransferase [Chloroflexota bacterium]